MGRAGCGQRRGGRVRQEGAPRYDAKIGRGAGSAVRRVAALEDRVRPRVVAVDEYDGAGDGPGPGDAFCADEDVEIYSASEAYAAPSTPAAAPAAALETL